MSTQIWRHFCWRHAAWREPWQTSNRIRLSFTDARVSAQMVSSLKSVRMQAVWCHEDGSALFFQDKAPRSFPGQCDDVDVFFGVERSSVALCGAPFTAPGCSSAPCAVCFFYEWKIFRPLFFVAPRFVQSHWNHIKGRTGLGNLKRKTKKAKNTVKKLKPFWTLGWNSPTSWITIFISNWVTISNSLVKDYRVNGV